MRSHQIISKASASKKISDARAKRTAHKRRVLPSTNNPRALDPGGGKLQTRCCG